LGVGLCLGGSVEGLGGGRVQGQGFGGGDGGLFRRQVERGAVPAWFERPLVAVRARQGRLKRFLFRSKETKNF
jgi:hypothetical protein